MIELKGLCKSLKKRGTERYQCHFREWKDQPDYRAERFGKTVLMKCIVGLLTPDKGELLYDHRNFLAMGKKEKKALRREMGMISKVPRCSIP